MASALKGLLAPITTAVPDALVAVAQIVLLGHGDNAVIKAYSQAIPGIGDARVAAKKHVSISNGNRRAQSESWLRPCIQRSTGARAPIFGALLRMTWSMLRAPARPDPGGEQEP